jgi:hypothetical protein
MFDKEIEFIANQDFIDLNISHPKPIKLNIPNWYKKLEHTHLKQTVKGCMPFLDALTSGYVLELTQDVLIQHNLPNQEGTPSTSAVYALKDLDLKNKHGINLNDAHFNYQIHNTDQIEGSPQQIKNKFLPLHKILNPWIIKTPPGYSCLFTPPLNNKDDRFEIISGIVDTDSYETEINFPIVINGDKYPVLNEVIKKGTPYVQIIPFKRESWKMKIHSKTPGLKLNQLSFYTKLINKYKTLNWSKKSWK